MVVEYCMEVPLKILNLPQRNLNRDPATDASFSSGESLAALVRYKPMEDVEAQMNQHKTAKPKD